jgi:hypothetical protein
VSYEERGQGYRDVEKIGKHWCSEFMRRGIRRSFIRDHCTSMPAYERSNIIALWWMEGKEGKIIDFWNK